MPPTSSTESTSDPAIFFGIQSQNDYEPPSDQVSDRYVVQHIQPREDTPTFSGSYVLHAPIIWVFIRQTEYRYMTAKQKAMFTYSYDSAIRDRHIAPIAFAFMVMIGFVFLYIGINVWIPMIVSLVASWSLLDVVFSHMQKKI